MLNVILKKVIFRSGHNSKHQIKIRPYFKTDIFDCAQISFEIRHLLSPHINNKQNENNGEIDAGLWKYIIKKKIFVKEF